MRDRQELLDEQTENLTDVSQLSDDFDELQDEDKSFHKGDTMVLIADYTDDTDYAIYIDSDSLNEESLGAVSGATEASVEIDKSDSEIDSADLKSSSELVDNLEFDTIKIETIINEIPCEEDRSDDATYADNNEQYIPSKRSARPIVQDAAEVNKKTINKRRRQAIIACLCLLTVIIGTGIFRIVTVKAFPQGAKVNGIDVSNLDDKEAARKMDAEKNKINLIKDGKNLGEATTLYKFESKKAMKKALLRAAIDPYAIYRLGTKKGLKAPLKVVGGIDQTVPLLLEVDEDNAKVEQTKDAYVDLDKGEIVAEFQGKNVDYKKVSKKIAGQLKENPIDSKFQYKSSDFYAVPKIKSADLKDELEFVKSYIVAGMDVETPGGATIHVTPTELNKIIQYSKDGPKYSREGADEVAKIVIEKFKGEESTITINTTSGLKTMINYDFNADVDEKNTANNIFEAAKEKKKAKIELSKDNDLNLSNRVEIDLSSQTMTLVLNDEASSSWPIVSGGPGHRTPTGLFALAYKTSPATLKGENADGSKYESKVTYWMPFNGGIGIHDADGWRAAYGGSIYVYGGSHGCINVPTVAARTLYNSINAGTPILVFR